MLTYNNNQGGDILSHTTGTQIQVVREMGKKDVLEELAEYFADKYLREKSSRDFVDCGEVEHMQ